MLSGIHTGRVKAMFNENGQKVTEAGPSTPVQVLGLNGAPQAGDTFNVMEDDRSAREIANKREQLQRIQGIMTQKHVTLDEIGRRIAIGSFKELNIIVKGDVDGSVEAMSGSLIKLSKETVQVNVIHSAVGQISESDVLLAAASNAIIVGFQVRPSASARNTISSNWLTVESRPLVEMGMVMSKPSMGCWPSTPAADSRFWSFKAFCTSCTVRPKLAACPVVPISAWRNSGFRCSTHGPHLECVAIRRAR